jgi:hypothetical protein
MVLSACAPALTPLPATVIPTLTPEPTPTSSPAPTATITLTPTPSLPADFPPEFAAKIGDAKWEIKDDGHIWVTGADGQEQDMFQIESDGDGWRYSDARLIASAPNQEWWPDGRAYGDEFDSYSARLIIPEPEVKVTVQIQVADGTVITVTGPRVIIPDKNDLNLIHRLIFPESMSSTDGFSWKLNFKVFCPDWAGCGDSFMDNQQYTSQYLLYKVTKAAHPITDHFLKVSIAQGFKELITGMNRGEAKIWPDNIVFQIGGVIEEVKPLNLDN